MILIQANTFSYNKEFFITLLYGKDPSMYSVDIFH